MSSTLDFDAQASAQIEALYATPDIAATRVAAFRAADPRRGDHALDIGCGPGYLLRDLAAAVGNEGVALGVDLSAPMLAAARQRCAAYPQTRCEIADATRIPAADGSIDVACVLQVYAYVSALDAALAELRRVLKPDGRAVILDSDFGGLVWESRDRARMQRVLTAYDRHVAWPDLPRILPRRLRAAGLTLQRCEATPIVTLNYHAHTYVHGLARFIHRFVTEQADVAKTDADAWLDEQDDLARAGGFFFALNRFVFTITRAA